MQPFLHHPPEQAIYVQVKRADTPIVNGTEVEEVWVYDTVTWTRRSQLRLREQLTDAPANLADERSTAVVDLSNYGLALSPDGQSVYSLTKQGLLQIDQGPGGRLNGTRLDVVGQDPESFAWKFVVP